MSWANIQTITSRRYTCGYCGNIVANDKGYGYQGGYRSLVICPHCDKPTFFILDSETNQYPGPVPGTVVTGLPSDLDAIYNEARKCVSVGAYTSAVLSCRKLLMNIAVNKGDNEGKSFTAYIDYLSAMGYVPPDGKGWVDQIRSKGNEATHEIKLMSLEDALELISFSEMLLKFIYEFPSRIKKTP